MSRIVAGQARGRRLAVPEGRDTRPTSDRVREALFASLEADLGDLDGHRVLDLYAGSGAVGIEALSRGAGAVVLVEASRRVAGLIRQNLRTIGLPGGSVLVGKVERLVSDPPPADLPFDVVFLDPPYAMTDEAVRGVLGRLREHHWLATDAVVVLERSTRTGEFAWPDGFVADRMRRYGDTALWYGRAASGE
ncbi:16S rRNA (guanine(966)-N(2))-methyltransferase RsmD [Actinopolymorpha alba]|uniref:16S rRNA (guanine(966)-N(2))-methyltransferase RsmD n=1 Tax=Actinopolymorpha alba TaxID=533267 RepID=UPI0003721FEE|nr:16S rRNA (guanine(966)-N(2))-methyltransferase RsmD [Actinopolymorpha alba]